MLGETHPLSPLLPVILAIQFEQVEGIDEDLIVMRIRGSRSKSDFPSLPHQTASPPPVYRPGKGTKVRCCCGTTVVTRARYADNSTSTLRTYIDATLGCAV